MRSHDSPKVTELTSGDSLDSRACTLSSPLLEHSIWSHCIPLTNLVPPWLFKASSQTNSETVYNSGQSPIVVILHILIELSNFIFKRSSELGHFPPHQEKACHSQSQLHFKKTIYPSSGKEGCKVRHSFGVNTTSKSSSVNSPSSWASSTSRLFRCVIRSPSKSTGSTGS